MPAQTLLGGMARDLLWPFRPCGVNCTGSVTVEKQESPPYANVHEAKDVNSGIQCTTPETPKPIERHEPEHEHEQSRRPEDSARTGGDPAQHHRRMDGGRKERGLGHPPASGGQAPASPHARFRRNANPVQFRSPLVGEVRELTIPTGCVPLD